MTHKDPSYARLRRLDAEIDRILRGHARVGREEDGYIDTKDAAAFLQDARDMLKRGRPVVLQETRDYLIAGHKRLTARELERLQRLEDDYQSRDVEEELA